MIEGTGARTRSGPRSDNRSARIARRRRNAARTTTTQGPRCCQRCQETTRGRLRRRRAVSQEVRGRGDVVRPAASPFQGGDRGFESRLGYLLEGCWTSFPEQAEWRSVVEYVALRLSCFSTPTAPCTPEVISAYFHKENAGKGRSAPLAR